MADSICQSCKEEESMVVGGNVACPRSASGRCYGNGRTDSGWYRSCCMTCSWVLNQCQMCGQSVDFYAKRGNWRTYLVTFRVADTNWHYRHFNVLARNVDECLARAERMIATRDVLKEHPPASVWAVVDLSEHTSGFLSYTPVVYISPDNPYGS